MPLDHAPTPAVGAGDLWSCTRCWKWSKDGTTAIGGTQCRKQRQEKVALVEALTGISKDIDLAKVGIHIHQQEVARPGLCVLIPWSVFPPPVGGSYKLETSAAGSTPLGRGMLQVRRRLSPTLYAGTASLTSSDTIGPWRSRMDSSIPRTRSWLSSTCRRS